MLKVTIVLRLGCLITFIFFLLPDNAHAYVDPGAGSTIYQSILSVVTWIGVFFRKLRKIFSFKK